MEGNKLAGTGLIYSLGGLLLMAFAAHLHRPEGFISATIFVCTGAIINALAQVLRRIEARP